MAKADCQAAMTILEAKIAELAKQEDEKTSNGPDSREYALAQTQAAAVTVRAEIEALV